MLLTAAGRTVTHDALIDGVWGDDLPADPQNTLQHAIAQLRKLIEPGRRPRDPAKILVSDDAGYRLNVGTAGESDFDAARFTQQLDAARGFVAAGNADLALGALDEGLSMWRGVAYGDVTDVAVVDAERQRLTELQAEARELRVSALEVVAGAEAAIAELETLVGEYPHRESLWHRLMTALYGTFRQADALRVYRRASDHLAELGLEPGPELRELEQLVLLQDPSLAAPKPVARHNLPAPVSSLVGRAADVAAVVSLLDQSRLVTLMGPGGSGKTTLALAAAHELVATASRHVDDGAWLVRLDQLSDRALVAPTIGEALSMPEVGSQEVSHTLATYIGQRRALLLLDNCEHVADSVGELVSGLLDACPALTVLATTQVALEVSAEHRFQVTPLSLESVGGERAPAVQLFIERGLRVDAGATLQAPTEETLALVAEIVGLLDGLPLAVELAAAGLDLSTPREVRDLMLEHAAPDVAGPRNAPQRQRSLRAVFDWSYALLDAADQAFMCRMAVFAGSFDIAAAALLGAVDEHEARIALRRLVARSLIQRVPGSDPPRFRILQTLRAFGRGMLGAAEREALELRHAQWCADEAVRCEQELMTSQQLLAYRRLASDRGNHRAAMRWALEHADEGLELGVRIASHLTRFWDWTGELAEANTWIGRFVAAAGDRRDIEDLSRLLAWQAFFASELGDAKLARAGHDAAVELAAARGDAETLMVIASANAVQARFDGDLEASLRHGSALRERAAALDEAWFVALADNLNSLAHLELGDLEAAHDRAVDSQRGFEECGDTRAVGWALTAMAQIALAAGEVDQAHELAASAAQLSAVSGDGRNAAWAKQLAAAAARRDGADEDATRLEAEAEQLLSARGMAASPFRGGS